MDGHQYQYQYESFNTSSHAERISSVAAAVMSRGDEALFRQYARVAAPIERPIAVSCLGPGLPYKDVLNWIMLIRMMEI